MGHVRKITGRWNRGSTAPRLGLCVCLLAAGGCRAAPATPERPPRTVKVAAVQFASRMGDPARNRRGLEKLVREAAENMTDLPVLQALLTYPGE